MLAVVVPYCEQKVMHVRRRNQREFRAHFVSKWCKMLVWIALTIGAGKGQALSYDVHGIDKKMGEKKEKRHQTFLRIFVGALVSPL